MAYNQNEALSQASPSLTEDASPLSVTACGVDRLGPPLIIRQIIDDWFSLVHSVCPIFHRAIFINRLESGEAAHDGIFAALVVSVCAATITSLKRKSSIDYGILTIERCFEVAEQIESQIGKQPYTLEWCQMKYHLGIAIAHAKSFDDADSFRQLAESANGVKYMTFYTMQNMSTVSQQLLKRLFWLLFVGFW